MRLSKCYIRVGLWRLANERGHILEMGPSSQRKRRRIRSNNRSHDRINKRLLSQSRSKRASEIDRERRVSQSSHAKHLLGLPHASLVPIERSRKWSNRHLYKHGHAKIKSSSHHRTNLQRMERSNCPHWYISIRIFGLNRSESNIFGDRKHRYR